MQKIAVVGAAGRMGRRLVANIAASSDLELFAATEMPDNPFIGQDAGEVAGAGKLNVAITSGNADAFAGADVAIIFATGGVLDTAKMAAATNCALVIGTTALSSGEQRGLSELADGGAKIVFAYNMSVGVNLLFGLVAEAARALGEAYNVEIVELHHNQKKDAPSGTAVRLAEIICEERSWDYDENLTHGREGMVGARPKREIGMHSLRGGDAVGDHTVIFASEGERIELIHRASNRDAFALGALRAVRFLADAKPGLYNMQDVLGLKK